MIGEYREAAELQTCPLLKAGALALLAAVSDIRNDPFRKDDFDYQIALMRFFYKDFFGLPMFSDRITSFSLSRPSVARAKALLYSARRYACLESCAAP